MTTPNAFRAESERIPFASIDVRHSTPLHARFWLRFSSMTSGSWGHRGDKRMGDFVALSRGVR